MSDNKFGRNYKFMGERNRLAYIMLVINKIELHIFSDNGKKVITS